MTRNLTRTIAGLSLALFSVTACGDKKDGNEGLAVDSTTAANSAAAAAATDEVDVESIDIGRTVGVDGKIAEKLGEFRVRDTIVAVVETDDNAGGKELLARWTYGDNKELVEEQRQTVAAGSDVRTTFRLVKATAWPVGTYHLQVMHNGKELKTEQFTVK
ncbi:MAG TPA: hypothetical protein VE869_02170 [Gemmatimonas sp.]|nr:hypothetical protein [Gemmatimonas sp.]